MTLILHFGEISVKFPSQLNKCMPFIENIDLRSPTFSTKNRSFIEKTSHGLISTLKRMCPNNRFRSELLPFPDRTYILQPGEFALLRDDVDT